MLIWTAGNCITNNISIKEKTMDDKKIRGFEIKILMPLIFLQVKAICAK